MCGWNFSLFPFYPPSSPFKFPSHTANDRRELSLNFVAISIEALNAPARKCIIVNSTLVSLCEIINKSALRSLGENEKETANLKSK